MQLTTYLIDRDGKVNDESVNRIFNLQDLLKLKIIK